MSLMAAVAGSRFTSSSTAIDSWVVLNLWVIKKQQFHVTINCHLLKPVKLTTVIRLATGKREVKVLNVMCL